MFFVSLTAPANNSALTTRQPPFDVRGVVAAIQNSPAGWVLPTPFPQAEVDLVRLASDPRVPRPGPAFLRLGTRSSPTPPGQDAAIATGVDLAALGVTAGVYQLQLRWSIAPGAFAISRRFLTVPQRIL